MSADAAVSPVRARWNALFQGLQKMGRSLQLPIAVLPAAGILNRLGQPDVFGADGLGWTNVSKVMSGAGGALLDGSLGLPLLFCVGVAIGMAKKADGSTALAAVAGFLVYYNVLRQFPEDCPQGSKAVPQIGCELTDGSGTVTSFTYQNPGVFGGIVVGLAAAYFWQRFHRTRLVDWLGFFNGRRLVPIIMAFAAIVFAALCLWVWPPIGDALESFSDWLTGIGAWGAGVFGLANRALLVIGLHQFLNVPMWFQFGSYTKPDGTVVHGDINMFLAGDPDAGQFTTGFFPIMMFALPAAALAITHCAKPHRRKEVGGLMLSVALTSFVTGITEPLEYSFLFIAPLLYAAHAVLTGVSMAVTWALGVKDGFSFSAGLIDYVINWNLATRPWLIIPIGLAFAVVYYVLFRFAITKFDLKTPGREPEDEVEDVTKG
ncbi:PTS transporter subunit EIIC [Streptomyces griseoviridis]|uniref:PTS system N-acetylglucosamine-specific IIC component n=3 Tax=Streptomyces TaxID=1883 RepID=A0ABT9LEA8_STRGD|nr:MULTISPECIES: PTS transporter subunit EIIC [Streptomyces]MDP9682051.1 PTS system N-acetylglucosamine-specific IIC component [Streptomyces griseoviridis]GGS16526.1 PTS sugar transporter subunit IIA [Streptomyces niveoruber]GGT02798.1 PTS sugar transporter subunit IIA [Streptomyces griseoviridis]GGU34996.1 PTS sugar transporter subunit IIA [Streptomyces daghestanicus]GHI33948.1 PTS sugar transporter subunit IIA [Streptomyces daghestanicus]